MSNYTKFQRAAYALWEAGFDPHLVYDNGDWVRFRRYPKMGNGPVGGPLWPYIVVDSIRFPPGHEGHKIGLMWD